MACGDDNDYSERAMLSDIVTIAETSGPDGAVFTFQRYDDSPEIRLVDPSLSLDDEVKGLRALLRYYPESGEPYTSGNIKARALSVINNDTTLIRPVAKYNWNATPVYLHSVWRSGEYLNLHVRVVYSDKPRHFNLLVDSLTLTEPVPQVYLVHDKLDAPDNFLMETYASFDISNVWSLPTCEAIEVHINDSNLKKEVYTFTKTNN